jgi:hypothetical protein
MSSALPSASPLPLLKVQWPGRSSRIGIPLDGTWHVGEDVVAQIAASRGKPTLMLEPWLLSAEAS